MKKETAEKWLKIFGILYYIGAALIIGLGILVLTNNNAEISKQLVEVLKIEDTKDFKVETVAAIALFMSAALQALIAWSLRRAAKDGKKSTLALVFTTLGFVSSLLTLPGHVTASNIIAAIIDGLMLAMVLTVRKEGKAKKAKKED